MDAARGEFFRMADHSYSPTTHSENDETGADEAIVNAAQIELGFASSERLPPSGPSLPGRSRRLLHGQTAGRDLQVVVAARPIEEVQLEHALSSYLPPGKVLNLHLTDNRYTIISVQRRRDGYRVRAHRMFTGLIAMAKPGSPRRSRTAGRHGNLLRVSISEPRLIRAMARYVVHNDQRASKLLGDFIERNQDQIASVPRRGRPMVLRTQGQHYDLSTIFDHLNRRYFGGAHDARISWGPARRSAERRSIKVGSFSVEDRLIRVHPLLDQEIVPRYFLDWIVFHEMLHGKHAIRKVEGRRCFHPPEFTEEERQFPDYERARRWEKTHLDRLLG